MESLKGCRTQKLRSEIQGRRKKHGAREDESYDAEKKLLVRGGRVVSNRHFSEKSFPDLFG